MQRGGKRVARVTVGEGGRGRQMTGKAGVGQAHD